MGGMDWRAVEIVAEMLGVSDIERFVISLVAVRDWQKDNPAEQ